MTLSLKTVIGRIVPVTACLFAFSSAHAQTVDGPEVNWNASLWGKEREFTQAIEGVADYVSKQTGGKFKIKLHYGGALSKSKENLDGIKIGAFQAAMFCAGYHPGKNPAITVLELPFTYANLDQAQAATEAVYNHPYVVKEMARWNAKLLMGSLIPPQVIFGKGKLPAAIADYKGMRVRAVGGLAKALKAIGAVATSVPASETFTALDRGTVDAAVFTIGSAFSFGVADAAKWYTGNLKVGAPTCPVVVGLKAFNSLPPQYQKVLLDARKPAYERIKNAWGTGEKRNLPKLKTMGVKEITYTDAQIKKVRELGGQPIWTNWIKEKGDKGIPAKELFDIMMGAM